MALFAVLSHSSMVNMVQRFRQSSTAIRRKTALVFLAWLVLIIAALAEFERARVRKGGRAYKMTAARVCLAMAAMGQPETKIGGLCAELGVTRQTPFTGTSPQQES